MLFKKMLRDFKDNKGIFITIFILSFLAVFLFVGISSEVEGLIDVSSEFYDDTNLPDFWIYSDNFDNDTLEDIESISGINSLDSQLVVEAETDLKDNPRLTLHFPNKANLSKFYLVDGEKFDGDDEDGIWLDKQFADERNLTVGDEITVKFSGYNMTKTIRGIGYSPEYVFQASDSIVPDHYQFGFAYLSYDALDDNIPLDYNVVLLDVGNSSEIKSADDLESALDDKIGEEEYTSVVDKDNFYSVNQFNDEIEQHILSAAIFTVVFILISSLVLLTTMKRIINTQRTQIGILKALGFSKRKIVSHYLGYGFYIPLFGGIAGIILGPILLPPLFYTSMPKFYSLPRWEPSFRLYFIVIAIVIVILSVIVTYFSVRKIVNENAASTLNPKTPKSGKNRIFESLSIFKHFGFNLRWNLRSINRNKLRAIVSLIGVIGCVILTFTAFGMNDSLEDVKTWKFEEIDHFQTNLVLEDNITQSQLDDLIDEVNGTPIYEGSTELKANGIKKSASLSIYNETDLITVTDSSWNKVNLTEDGVAITEKMAELLKVDVGDTIKWHDPSTNKWYNATIDDIYSDPYTQGILMSTDKYESFDDDLNFTANEVISLEDVDKNYTGVRTVNTIDKLVDSFDSMVELMNTFVVIFLLFAIVLGIVILYNLGVMSYAETERELATLKVLGFNNKQLRRIIMLPNILYAIFGFIIGFIPAYYTLIVSMRTTGDAYYFPVLIHPQSVIFTFVFILAISIVVGLLISRKLKHLDMVESLKAKE